MALIHERLTRNSSLRVSGLMNPRQGRRSQGEARKQCGIRRDLWNQREVEARELRNVLTASERSNLCVHVCIEPESLQLCDRVPAT